MRTTGPKVLCNCIGHFMPGVVHIRACCDKPHITVEQYNDALWMKRGLVEELSEELELPIELRPSETHNIFEGQPVVVAEPKEVADEGN